MKNNKPINIYMGIIGEAYVDKETAYAVLLAAKKNILDVKAIIQSAEALKNPITKAQARATTAVNEAWTAYNSLKTALLGQSIDSSLYIKLYALLSELNINDFDSDPTNGGNIYTALENKNLADQLNATLLQIIADATDLLQANELNAIVRCKEYNIAKEIFESMIPTKYVSPEDLSDMLEAELIRQINEVRDNIAQVNIVSDKIIEVSRDVQDRVQSILDGTDEEEDTLMGYDFWFAGNINPNEDPQFMIDYGFTRVGSNSPVWKCDHDVSVPGPLKMNHWFTLPKTINKDGELIAGVDGKLKASDEYWYVVLPKYILTDTGYIQYKNYLAQATGTPMTATQFAATYVNTMPEWVQEFTPTKPAEGTDHPAEYHTHESESFAYEDTNEDGERNNGDVNINGYETNIDLQMIINDVQYVIWRIPATIYNRNRLNVYFVAGEPSNTIVAKPNTYYYYVGTAKPLSYSNDWVIITQDDVDNGIQPGTMTGSKVFYVMVPSLFGIYSDGIDQTEVSDEVTSKYTYVYSITVAGVSYNVYITGNSNSIFTDTIKPKEGVEITASSEIYHIVWSVPQGASNGGLIGGDYPENSRIQLGTLPQYTVNGTVMIFDYWTIGNSRKQPGDIYTVNAGDANNEKVITIIAHFKEKQKEYYWYIGYENPASPNVTPSTAGVDNDGFGWRLLGTTQPTATTYDQNNKLWAGSTNPLQIDPTRYLYIAVPYNPMEIYDNTGVKSSLFVRPDTNATVVLEGVTYYIWVPSGSFGTTFNFDIYNKVSQGINAPAIFTYVSAHQAGIINQNAYGNIQVDSYGSPLLSGAKDKILNLSWTQVTEGDIPVSAGTPTGQNTVGPKFTIVDMGSTKIPSFAFHPDVDEDDDALNNSVWFILPSAFYDITNKKFKIGNTKYKIMSDLGEVSPDPTIYNLLGWHEGKDYVMVCYHNSGATGYEYFQQIN